MKRFNITVNGKAYDVSVEELAAGAAPVAPVAAPTPAPAAAPSPSPAPVAAPVAAPAVVEGGTKVNAPMPGTILDVKCSVGDSVTTGQVLVVLEAMKMENEIVAPSAGKVVGVSVKKGDSVNSNDVLVVIQ